MVRTFVTLRLGRVGGPGRRELLAVRRRRAAVPSRPVPRAQRRHRRATRSAISHTVDDNDDVLYLFC